MGKFYSAPQNDVEHKYDFFIKIVLEHNSMNMGAKLHMGQRLKFFFLGRGLIIHWGPKTPRNHRFH